MNHKDTENTKLDSGEAKLGFFGLHVLCVFVVESL
jgi:hypothetical protein